MKKIAVILAAVVAAAFMGIAINEPVEAQSAPTASTERWLDAEFQPWEGDQPAQKPTPYYNAVGAVDGAVVWSTYDVSHIDGPLGAFDVASSDNVALITDGSRIVAVISAYDGCFDGSARETACDVDIDLAKADVITGTWHTGIGAANAAPGTTVEVFHEETGTTWYCFGSGKFTPDE